jgi:CheY-like chemotaxis protein
MLFGSQDPPVVVVVVVPPVLVPVVEPPLLVPVVVVVVVVVVVLDAVVLDPPVVVPVELEAGGSLEQATRAHEAIKVSAIFIDDSLSNPAVCELTSVKFEVSSRSSPTLGYIDRMAAVPFRILLVEDEPLIRDLVKNMFADAALADVEVHSVADGTLAIQIARKSPPNLVLLDIVLPGLDGLATCRILRAQPTLASVPVYMLTAKVRHEDHEASRRAGADGHIEKPFRGRELVDLVLKLRDQGVREEG